MSKIARPAKILEIIDAAPVAVNVHHLDRRTIGNQGIQQGR